MDKGEIISATVNNFFDNSEWEKAKIYIEKELLEAPNDYWLISTLAITYYELRDYVKALSLSENALSINPKDYLVLDYHACILSVIPGKELVAIKFLKKIVKTDINKMAYGPTGEGMKWAKSIINDCRVRLAMVYHSINKVKEAILYLNEHLVYRERGIFSNFTKNEVLKMKSKYSLEAALV